MGLLRLCALGMLCAALLSCGGDGGVAEPPPAPSGWVNIDAPADTDTVCNGITLSGAAFISPTDWHCCTGTAAEMTAVTVSWRNETTGVAGTADQSVRLGLVVPLYDHTWRASVPLQMGANTIAVTATDTAGLTATARIDIVKTGPSYGLSGRVISDSGLWGIGYGEAGVRVQLSGPVNATALPLDGAGQGGYGATCLPPGRYTVTPESTAFALAFQPLARTVDIVAADVIGVDFQAPVHRVSGQVTWAISGLPATAELITVGQGAISLVRAVDAQGRFGFLLPDGPFTVAPTDPLCPTCSFTPDHRDVQVQGADLAGVDFVRN